MGTTDGPERVGARPYVLNAPAVYRFPRERSALLSWTHAEQRLRAARRYWLVTVRADGRPHATPLWGVWVADALYFDGPATTVWGRNLSRRPEATMHLESGDDTLIIEGRVEDLTTAVELGERVKAAWAEKYGRLVPEPSTRGIWRLRPRRARGWSAEDLRDGTGWRMAAR
ncbi:MAG TPA: pyridoxamine 5'-phosphate oxidase family protein [Candidatus Limnocylindria bacterium]|nr:pyridoxamine 5'-phosphate oxidase family protein [Candidatus Limnocylindria bacterium]